MQQYRMWGLKDKRLLMRSDARGIFSRTIIYQTSYADEDKKE